MKCNRKCIRDFYWLRSRVERQVASLQRHAPLSVCGARMLRLATQWVHLKVWSAWMQLTALTSHAFFCIGNYIIEKRVPPLYSFVHDDFSSSSTTNQLVWFSFGKLLCLPSFKFLLVYFLLLIFAQTLLLSIKKNAGHSNKKVQSRGWTHPIYASVS